VDLKSGRLVPVKEKEPRLGVVVRDICPASPGAKDWQPAAYSPRTGYVYVPHNNLCMDFEGVEANYIAGTPFVGANVRYYAGPGGHRGEFSAWDPVARRKVWSIKESFPVWSGTVATAGDVVFYGTMEGWFKAVDARSGDLLNPCAAPGYDRSGEHFGPTRGLRAHRRLRDRGAGGAQRLDRLAVLAAF
jgi:glucose dehydrogenase